jgi:hypothetical protein
MIIIIIEYVIFIRLWIRSEAKILVFQKRRIKYGQIGDRCQ